MQTIGNLHQSSIMRQNQVRPFTQTRRQLWYTTSYFLVTASIQVTRSTVGGPLTPTSHRELPSPVVTPTTTRHTVSGLTTRDKDRGGTCRHRAELHIHSPFPLARRRASRLVLHGPFNPRLSNRCRDRHNQVRPFTQNTPTPVGELSRCKIT